MTTTNFQYCVLALEVNRLFEVRRNVKEGKQLEEGKVHAAKEGNTDRKEQRDRNPGRATRYTLPSLKQLSSKENRTLTAMKQRNTHNT